MKLLGEWNWYLPRWLEWLPRFEPEEPVAVPEARRRSPPRCSSYAGPGRG